MIEIYIQKPLGKNLVFVRDKYIKLAEKSGEKLHIATPRGDIVCTPAQWKYKARKMQKRFKFSDAMVLWGNIVPIGTYRFKSLNPKPKPIFDEINRTVRFV